jgi:hypothetical protein
MKITVKCPNFGLFSKFSAIFLWWKMISKTFMRIRILLMWIRIRLITLLFGSGSRTCSDFTIDKIRIRFSQSWN